MIQVIDEHHLRVGDRVWWGTFHSESLHDENVDWEMRQFMVRFESKWMVSVVWGYGTYSDNYDLPWHIFKDEFPEPFNETPATVEVGILHADRENLQPDGDPLAYINDEGLNTLLTYISTLSNDAELPSDLVLGER